jgi:hypothetical protein
VILICLSKKINLVVEKVLGPDTVVTPVPLTSSVQDIGLVKNGKEINMPYKEPYKQKPKKSKKKKHGNRY